MYNDRMCPNCMNDTGGEKICSICGYDTTSKNQNFCLPVKFFLSERYVIGKALSVCSENITYIAWDNASDSAVQVKEYFPGGIAARNPDKTVTVVSGKEFYFNEGLIDFIEINKKFIATELQSVVPVITVFEENGTVYAVSPVISSITLQNFLDRNGGSLRWEQARPLFLPLIDTLKSLHEMGIVHGGISPETILVGRDGKLRFTNIFTPRLRVASANNPAELYGGYAAVEQYGKTEGTLSVASDVYAISAVLFRVLIGTVPPSAEDRMQRDTLSIPSRFADELPRQVLVAIANGMQVNVLKRTMNIDAFKNELVYGETQENLRRAANVRAAEQMASQQSYNQPEPKKNSIKYAAISAGVTVGVVLIVALVLYFTGVFDKIFGTNTDNSSSQDSEISTPESEVVGDVDPNVSETVITEDVPDFVKEDMYYYEIAKNEEYKWFRFSIKGKEYSNKKAGTVCAQSIAAGTPVENGTEIELTISLGPKEIKMIDVVGKEYQDVIPLLWDLGILYDNVEIVVVYDPTSVNGLILEQYPAAGSSITTEEHIRIHVNEVKTQEEPEETKEPEEPEINTRYP